MSAQPIWPPPVTRCCRRHYDGRTHSINCRGAARVRGYCNRVILRSAQNLPSGIRCGLSERTAVHPTFSRVLEGDILGDATVVLLALLLADASVPPVSRLAAHAMGTPPRVMAVAAAAAERIVTCVVNGYGSITLVSVVTLARPFAAIVNFMGLGRVHNVEVNLGLGQLTVNVNDLRNVLDASTAVVLPPVAQLRALVPDRLAIAVGHDQLSA